jgi:hypothetical protein
MIVEDVYGNVVIKIQCEDESIYKNKLLMESVEQVYTSPVVTKRVRETVGDSQKGTGLTTVGQPYPLISLPGASKLEDWLTEQFLSVKDLLGCSHKGDKVFFKRSWTNRMFYGAFGHVHQHVRIDNYIKNLTGYNDEDFCPDAVGILYVNVPENSSNLVFVKDGAPDLPVEYFKQEDTTWLKPEEGMLVIHSPEVWHGVSKHLSDSSRDVFVFDIDYV